MLCREKYSCGRRANLLEIKIQQLKDMSVDQNERFNEILKNILQGLSEVGQSLIVGNVENAAHMRINPETVETSQMKEKFTTARLYISQMNSGAKNLAQRCQDLKSFQTAELGM